MENISKHFELEFDGVTGKAVIHKNEVEKIQNELDSLREQLTETEEAAKKMIRSRDDRIAVLEAQNAELIKALKNLLDFPKNDLNTWEETGATITLTGWHIKQARAALAKYE